MCRQVPPTAGRTELLAVLAGSGVATGTVCDGCGKADLADGVKLKTCGRCSNARYCSTACQLEAWPGHKPECALLRAAKDKNIFTRSVPADMVKPEGAATFPTS